ncbi:MAG: PsiF family protein [Betaproteobacteria bacterium]
MKTCLSVLAVCLAFTFSGAQAATEQQNKMATCNKEATGKKGDERKAFMKECLSKKPAEEPKPAMNSQQNKMATCNKEAAGKKGDERKQFMSECLTAK